MKLRITLAATTLLTAGFAVGLAGPASAAPDHCTAPLCYTINERDEVTGIENRSNVARLGQFKFNGKTHTACFTARKSYALSGASGLAVLSGPCPINNDWTADDLKTKR